MDNNESARSNKEINKDIFAVHLEDTLQPFSKEKTDENTTLNKRYKNVDVIQTSISEFKQLINSNFNAKKAHSYDLFTGQVLKQFLNKSWVNSWNSLMMSLKYAPRQRKVTEAIRIVMIKKSYRFISFITADNIRGSWKNTGLALERDLIYTQSNQSTID